MVTTAEPDAVALAWETAVTVTVARRTPPLPSDLGHAAWRHEKTSAGDISGGFASASDAIHLPGHGRIGGTSDTALNCCVPKTFTVTVVRFRVTTLGRCLRHHRSGWARCRRREPL